MLKSRPVVLIVLAVTFVLASPVYFVVQTVLADQVGAALMTAGLAVGVFVLATVVTGLPRRDELLALGGRDALFAAFAGVVGVFGSQYLVLTHRYSDAPPGAEVLFFTTAVWGVLVLLAVLFTSRKPTLLQVLSGTLALMGVAAVLANWERPSSFSPFVRYPAEDVAMIAAGVGWAVFSIIIAGLGRRHRVRSFLPVATAASAAVAVLVALASPDRFAAIAMQPELWLQLFVGACALTAMLVSWTLLAAAAGVSESAGLLFVPAIALTIFGIYERRMGTGGPSPLLWGAVTGGSAVALAGAVGAPLLRRALSLALSDESRGHTKPLWGRAPRLRRGTVVAAAALAGVALLLSVWALALPLLAASAEGARGGGEAYSAEWTLPGAETPAGWIAFISSGMVLAAAVSSLRGRERQGAALAASLIAAVGFASVPSLLDTPLRTWTRWIPGEIQQDYGTEYARLTLTRVHEWPLTAALVAGGAAALVLGVIAVVALSQGARTPAVRDEDDMSADVEV